MWTESGLEWSTLLPSGKSVDDFLQSNVCGFAALFVFALCFLGEESAAGVKLCVKVRCLKKTLCGSAKWFLTMHADSEAIPMQEFVRCFLVSLFAHTRSPPHPLASLLCRVFS